MSVSTLRKIILAFAALEFLFRAGLGLLKVIFQYFLSLGYVPLNLFGEPINLLNIVALGILAVIIATETSNIEFDLSNMEMAALVVVIPLLYTFSVKHGLKIKHSLLWIGLIALLSYGKFRLLDPQDRGHPGVRLLYLVNICCLLSVATGFLLSLRWGVDLAVLMIGGYYVLVRFNESVLNAETWPDLLDLIYSSVLSLGREPIGTIFAGVAFTALYWVYHLGPNMLIAPASVDGYANLSALPFFTTVMAAPFILALFVYWTYILRRLPYSVAYWKRGRFQREEDSQAPVRLGLPHFFLYFTGWILAAAPQYFARLSRSYEGLRTDQEIVIIYLALILFWGVLSITSLLPPVRDKIGFGAISDPISINDDYIVIKWSFISVIFAIGFGAFFIQDSPFDLLYLLIVSLTAWSEKRSYGVDSLLSYLPLLIILIPFITTTSTNYWTILFFISIGYLCTKLAELLKSDFQIQQLMKSVLYQNSKNQA